MYRRHGYTPRYLRARDDGPTRTVVRREEIDLVPRDLLDCGHVLVSQPRSAQQQTRPCPDCGALGDRRV